MSEFRDVFSNTYGDLRTRLVDRAMAPYEAEVVRQWRASHAAPEVAEAGLAGEAFESVPPVPPQSAAPLEEMGSTSIDGLVLVSSRP